MAFDYWCGTLPPPTHSGRCNAHSGRWNANSYVFVHISNWATWHRMIFDFSRLHVHHQLSQILYLHSWWINLFICCVPQYKLWTHSSSPRRWLASICVSACVLTQVVLVSFSKTFLTGTHIPDWVSMVLWSLEASSLSACTANLRAIEKASIKSSATSKNFSNSRWTIIHRVIR